LFCRLPQLLYPSAAAAGTPSAAFLPATGATPTALTPLPQPGAAPHSPAAAAAAAQALAAVGHPLIEYSALAFGPQLHASAAGFDAFQTAAAPAPGFLAQTAAPSATFAPIAYAAPATPVSTHQLAHYRPLMSIQDRI